MPVASLQVLATPHRAATYVVAARGGVGGSPKHVVPVFALTIISLLVGLGAGLYLTIGFLPALAATFEGTLATWLVRVLVALAASWTCVQIYLAIHAYAIGVPPGIYATYERSEILTHAVESILMPAAVLVALAAVVFLLAPAGGPPEGRSTITGSSD